MIEAVETERWMSRDMIEAVETELLDVLGHDRSG